MTIEEFNSVGWTPGMKARHRDGNVYDVTGCDFEEKLVGLSGMVSGASDDYISWVRCESVDIAKSEASKKSGHIDTTGLIVLGIIAFCLGCWVGAIDFVVWLIKEVGK